jgi:hypothetical protein
VVSLPFRSSVKASDLHPIIPCRYLLLATDGPRLVVLRTQDWSQLATIHGLVTEQFHVPAVCWARDSHYLFTSESNPFPCQASFCSLSIAEPVSA